ncbi:MAG: protein kinase domain-containing protein [Planctomycetota bacterium]|jgi:hypothetical protein
MTLHCPKCGKSFEKGVFPLGDRVGCPYCQTTFKLAEQMTMPYGPEGAPVAEPPAEPPSPSKPEETPEAAPDPPKAEGDSPPGEGTPPPRDSEVIVIESDVTPAVGPGTRLGGFLLKEEIGRGGMGVVYLGIQESLNREVAVKVLPADFSKDKQFVSRFEREAKSLANLSHPSIVGREGGRPSRFDGPG